MSSDGGWGWEYAGITSTITIGINHVDELAVAHVSAIQHRDASGAGDHIYRRVNLREEQRIGPKDGGSPDHRELDTDKQFDQVGVVTNHKDGPLTETAGVVFAEVGFGVEDPLWYWVPIEHDVGPTPECTCSGDEACDICGGAT